jgi:multidrug efflux pump subunit AcrA (membrane-fusion protein)
MVLWAVLLAAALFTPKTNGEAMTPGAVTLSGTVHAVDEDEEGNVTQVVLATEDQDYYVESTGKGRELFKKVGEQVTVKGTVSDDGYGDLLLRVNGISP